MHVLALTDGRGRLMWISAARPGRTHDITAARRDRILAHLRAASLGALVVTGFKATRAPAGSHPPRRRPTGSRPPDASPSNAALPT
ncbi:hypothetical protein ACH492_38605 [Streptomyces sp. NPDC019443]|uniref:hypothetical protein n=1 Tax=Streptomyces sp. NPDC019443 TaxID=3365061 RepID=UPI0037AC39B7